MSDVVDSGASAPADSAPATETPVTLPNPISTEPIPAEPKPEPVKDDKPKEPEKPVSTREALKKAAEKVEADSKPKEEAKPKPVDDKGPTRGEDGKFASTKPAEAAEKPAGDPAAPKPVEPPKAKYEAPARLADDVKGMWNTLPERAQAEVDRMHREMSQGLEKYKTSAERDESLREFHEMAERGGTTVRQALQNYTNMEQLLRSNPIQGFEKLAANLGISFRDLASHYLGQPIEQQQSREQAYIAQLEAKIAQIEHGFTSFKGELESKSVQQEIAAFAADKPRFEELKADIGKLLQGGLAETLADAYEMAERLKPAPITISPVASSAPAPDPVAQTDKGRKSINGSPTPGSNPALRQPSTSIKESIRRAMAQAG